MEDATERTKLLGDGEIHKRRNSTMRTATASCSILMALVMCLTVSLTTSLPHVLLDSATKSNKSGGDHVQPHVIELAKFKLRQGVDIPNFLHYAAALQPFFSHTGDTIQRSLAFNEVTGEWADIIYWSTMTAALKAAEDIQRLPVAQPFLKSINATTLRLTHSIIQLDWMPLRKGPVVEVASFPLVHGVAGVDFVHDAEATTPFFHRIGTAKHRVLAQGDDESTWYDLVYWSSVNDAKRAADAIEHVSAARPFLDAIDSKSPRFEFAYYDVKLWQDIRRGRANNELERINI